MEENANAEVEKNRSKSKLNLNERVFDPIGNGSALYSPQTDTIISTIFSG